MSYTKADTWVLQQIAATGLPLVGGSVSAYITGTTTPLAMYTSSAGAGSATSFTLNSLGMPQSAGGTAIDIYLDTSKVYKFIIKDAAGVAVPPDIDPVYPAGPSAIRAVSTVAAMKAIPKATLADGEIVTVGCYSTTGYGGGLYQWRASSSATAVQGIIVASDEGGNGRFFFHESQKITPETVGCVLDGDGAGGGTNNSTNMQIFLDYVRDNGGSFHSRGGTYRCDTGLTLLSNSTARRSYIIDFGGAVFDFSASAATSGDFFAIGATSQANAHDNEIDNIRNFRIIGNEPSFNTATVPTTSCVGISLEYSLRLRLENAYVQSCYEGFKTNWVFDLQTDNCQAIACYVGLRIDDSSTYALWNNWQAINNRYGTVVKPGTSGAITGNQTFVNPRFEGNSVGCAIDGGTNASFGIRSLTFINTYAENNTYDLFREGLQWTIADPATRNAACVGYVVNTTILGGDWSGMTWGASCAAIAWPASIGTVLGGEYRIPATIANCVNYPGKSTYQQVLDLTAGLGQNMQPTSMPGYGVLVIRGSDGATTISNNLISSTSRTGVGVYEINFREAFTGSTDYAVGATCDDGYVEIDTASCTASKLVLNCFSNAAAAIDPARVRVMIHGVLT